MWKGYYEQNDKIIKLVFTEFDCVPDDGIICGFGEDQNGKKFTLDGVIDAKRHFKFIATYTASAFKQNYEGIMKADLKVIGGHWGPNPDEVDEIFRMSLSKSETTITTKPKVVKEEKKVEE